MYDRNGLALTPVNTGLNTYKFTAVDVGNRKFAAYAQLTRNKGKFSMKTIRLFDDARDAAFVGQQFAMKYTPEQIFTMCLDDTFREIANEFLDQLELPEWKFPAEGLDWDDILGSKAYETNRVETARDALVEAIKVFSLKMPHLSEVKKLIASVEELYQTGVSYRAAAKKIMGVA